MFKKIFKEKLQTAGAVSLFEDVKDILGYSAAILRKHRRGLELILLLKALAFPLGLSLIYITKFTLDKGIFAKNLDMFLKLTVLGLVAFFITQTLRYFSEKKLKSIRAKFSSDVNYDLTRRLFGLDYLRIRELSSAENAFILDYDYHIIDRLVFDEVPSLFSVLKIPVFFTLAFLLSWPLTLLVLLSLPFMALHTVWTSRRKKEYKMKELSNSRKYYSCLHDFLLNIKLIKSFFKEDWALERASHRFREKTEGTLNSLLFSYKSLFIKDIFLKFNTALFWLLGGYLIIKGSLSFGTLTAVSLYVTLIIGEVYNISRFVQGLNEERPSIMRNAAFIREMSGDRKAPLVLQLLEDERFGSDIEFRSISFGYLKNKPLFRDLSLTVPGGKWTLIRGESGAGKTTLLSLFLRLFPSWEGKIYVGGSDAGMIDRVNFSRNVSVVHQEPYLFNDTLMSNILLGEERHSKDIEKALHCVKLNELACSLSMGYNCHIGESGAILSGGQKQRVAIARALLRDPKILLLDEATSFLDSNMEEEIFRNIRELFGSLTVIFVTHRDTARKFAEGIFLLEGGRIFNG